MSKLEPGVLALTKNMETITNNGRLVRVDRLYRDGEILPNHRHAYVNNSRSWICESLGGPLHTNFDGMQMTRTIAECCLFPIGDAPGNEQFVVESRKSLPRKKPVTGPVTIDVRGEPV